MSVIFAVPLSLGTSWLSSGELCQHEDLPEPWVPATDDPPDIPRTLPATPDPDDRNESVSDDAD